MSNAAVIAAHFPFSWRERQSTLKQVSNEIYDVCVVGGGITGAAIARDAALRGLRTLLIEKDDFASGTSSRSSKLVHGGLRYLEHLEFGLVMESTHERARLWKNDPHLVKPLPFLYPAFRDRGKPMWQLRIGLFAYDLLSFFNSPSRARRYSLSKTLQCEPALAGSNVLGAIHFWDAATNDALLTLANALDAAQSGAHVLSRVRLNSVQWSRQAPDQDKAPHQLQLQDTLAGTSFTAKARTVVCAAGPWTDDILKMAGIKGPKRLSPTRGSHIVLPASRLHLNHAIALNHPQDKRVMFAIPWSEFTIIGTTDIFDDKSPDSTHVNREEIEYMLKVANLYFPASKLTHKDVVSTWSGLRPLIAAPVGESASSVSREHVVEWHEPGLLMIAGGKLTTHRLMAKEAVDLLLKSTGHWEKPLRHPSPKAVTQHRPLPRFAFPQSAKTEEPIGQSEAARMSLGDIIGICRTQMVLSLEDLFVRRTEIFYKEPHNGWLLLPKLKATLMGELNWDEAEWQRQVQAYHRYLERAVLKPLARELPA